MWVGAGGAGAGGSVAGGRWGIWGEEEAMAGVGGASAGMGAGACARACAATGFAHDTTLEDTHRLKINSPAHSQSSKNLLEERFPGTLSRAAA
jgi:hypothetical protein